MAVIYKFDCVYVCACMNMYVCACCVYTCLQTHTYNQTNCYIVAKSLSKEHKYILLNLVVKGKPQTF